MKAVIVVDLGINGNGQQASEYRQFFSLELYPLFAFLSYFEPRTDQPLETFKLVMNIMDGGAFFHLGVLIMDLE